jgi:hypothetical protein
MFAALVLGPWLVSGILARATGRPWVGALDVMGATEKLLGQLLGAVDYAGLGAAAPSLAVVSWTAAFLGLAAWRLARAEVVRG